MVSLHVGLYLPQELQRWVLLHYQSRSRQHSCHSVGKVTNHKKNGGSAWQTCDSNCIMSHVGRLACIKHITYAHHFFLRLNKVLDYHVHKLVLLLCEGVEGRIRRNRKDRSRWREKGRKIETDNQQLLIKRPA